MKKQNTPEKQKKKKKEKIVYIDDGSTLADMSALDRSGKRRTEGEHRTPRASVREQLGTFFAAMRMMLLPMLFVMLVLSLTFLIFWLAAR